jgi:hypothetical protein
MTAKMLKACGQCVRWSTRDDRDEVQDAGSQGKATVRRRDRATPWTVLSRRISETDELGDIEP